MDWIKVTPETMPPDMAPILISVLYWNGNKAVCESVARFNKQRNEFEVWKSDGYAGGWMSSAIRGDVTHWMPYPEPAED